MQTILNITLMDEFSINLGDVLTMWIHVEVFKNGWLTIKNPSQMDDLGVPLF